MKPNLLERKKIYENALDIYKRERNNYNLCSLGICWAINRATPCHFSYVYHKPEDFPEFWLFRPHENCRPNKEWIGLHNNPDKEDIRELILMFAIEMTILKPYYEPENLEQ